MTKYIVTVMEEDHPLYGDYFYDVKKLDGGAYTGDGRFCRDVDELAQYFRAEEEKRNQWFTNRKDGSIIDGKGGE